MKLCSIFPFLPLSNIVKSIYKSVFSASLSVHLSTYPCSNCRKYSVVPCNFYMLLNFITKSWVLKMKCETLIVRLQGLRKDLLYIMVSDEMSFVMYKTGVTIIQK